jgi:hypothetical protein
MRGKIPAGTLVNVVDEVRGVSQSADHDGESGGINSE